MKYAQGKHKKDKYKGIKYKWAPFVGVVHKLPLLCIDGFTRIADNLVFTVPVLYTPCARFVQHC